MMIILLILLAFNMILSVNLVPGIKYTIGI